MYQRREVAQLVRMLPEQLGLARVSSPREDGFFSFLYLKKNSKIYGRFEKFQNSPSGWATGSKRKKKNTFRSWRLGRIKQQTCKIDIKS